MANKQFNVRQIQKHDTEANWDLTDGFIPMDGELIVYDKDATHDKPRIKIGDGVTDVKNLPFSGAETDARRDFTFTCTAQSSVYEDTVIGNLAITNAQIKDCFNKGIKIHGVGDVNFSIDIPISDGTSYQAPVLLDDIIFTPYLYVDNSENEQWHLVSTPFCTDDSSNGYLFIFVAQHDSILSSSPYDVTIKSYRGLQGEQGVPGDPGEPGQPGEPGVVPRVNFVDDGSGNITTDADFSTARLNFILVGLSAVYTDNSSFGLYSADVYSSNQNTINFVFTNNSKKIIISWSHDDSAEPPDRIEKHEYFEIPEMPVIDGMGKRVLTMTNPYLEAYSISWDGIIYTISIPIEEDQMAGLMKGVLDTFVSASINSPESLVRGTYPLGTISPGSSIGQILNEVTGYLFEKSPVCLQLVSNDLPIYSASFSAFSISGSPLSSSRTGTVSMTGAFEKYSENYVVKGTATYIITFNNGNMSLSLSIEAIAHSTKSIDILNPTAPLVMPMVPAPVSGTVTLSSSSWTDNLDGTYSQSITITGSTNYSKIDLQPNAAVLSQLSADGVGAIYVTNQNNVLSAIAVGNAPSADLSVQYVMSAVYDGAVTPGGGSTPQVVSITMPASWTDNSDGTYSQVITSLITTAGATLTNASKVDVQVSSSVVSQLTTDGVTGLYAQQNNGAVTMIMMGAEPSSTVTVQLTITETNVI